MNRLARGTRVLGAAAVVLAVLAPAVSAQEWQTLEQSRRLTDATPIRAEIRYGVGELTLGPAEDATRLWTFRLHYDAERFEPLQSFEQGVVRLGLEGTGRSLRLRSLDDSEGAFDVRLGSGVPIDLSVEFGAGRANLELGGLNLTGLTLATGASETRMSVGAPNPGTIDLATLQVGAAEFSATGLANLNARRLRVEAGVGEATLEFSGTLQRDLEVDVSMGLGALNLRMPRNVGVRIERSTSFLADLDADDMVERDGVLYSTNWDSAERRITISTTAALGSIEVSWLSARTGG